MEGEREGKATFNEAGFPGWLGMNRLTCATMIQTTQKLLGSCGVAAAHLHWHCCLFWREGQVSLSIPTLDDSAGFLVSSSFRCVPSSFSLLYSLDFWVAAKPARGHPLPQHFVPNSDHDGEIPSCFRLGLIGKSHAPNTLALASLLWVLRDFYLKYQIIFVLLLHCDLPGPHIHSLLRDEKAYIAQLA